MKQIAVIYDSPYGHTAKLAHAVKAGADSVLGVAAALLIVFGFALAVCTPARQESRRPPAAGKTGSLPPAEARAVAGPDTPARWDAQRRKGVDFVAMGTEPFWSLTMDHQGQMRFRTVAEGESLNAPIPPPSQAQDAPVVRYRTVTEAGELVVTIAQQACTNEMSGEAFAYTVTVRAKTKPSQEAREFTGCGIYLGDYRLHDIWGLESVNGQAVVTAQFPQQKPYVELNLVRQQVLGFAGCNEFSGSLTPERASLRFGPLPSTRISCPALKFEQQFLDILTGRAFTYRLENRRLMLENRVDTLVFRKVD